MDSDLILIFSRVWWADRAETIPGPGRERAAYLTRGAERAVLLCRDLGENESGWRLQRSGWRGPNGRAYEWRQAERADTRKGLAIVAPWSKPRLFVPIVGRATVAGDPVESVSLAHYVREAAALAGHDLDRADMVAELPAGGGDWLKAWRKTGDGWRASAMRPLS